MTARLMECITAGTLLLWGAVVSAQPVRGVPDPAAGAGSAAGGTAGAAVAPDGLAAGRLVPPPDLVDRSTGITLAQAVAQAMEREPSVRAAVADIEAARGARQQAALGPNPAVSFSQQREPGGTDAQSRVDVQWPLDLFRRPARVRVAEREVDTAGHMADARRWALAAEVRAAYGEVASAARDLALSDDVIAATARQFALVSARVEQGAAPPLDRDILSVELQRLRIDRLRQQGQAAQALLGLTRVLGLDPGAELRIADDLDTLVAAGSAGPLTAVTPGAPPGETPARGVADQRADVRAEAARLAAADARIGQARAEGRAAVSLFGGYMRTDSGFPQRGLTDAGTFERVRGVFHDVAAGASVTLPIRNRNQGALAAAIAERGGAAARLDAARLTARSDLASAQARDARAREALGLYDAGTRGLARKNLDIAIQAYALGRMTLLDSLAERRRYLEVERGYGSALREAYEARQALTRAMGEMP